MVKNVHRNFPKAKCDVFKMSSPTKPAKKTKDIQFPIIQNSKKQQILKLKKLKPEQVGLFKKITNNLLIIQIVAN